MTQRLILMGAVEGPWAAIDTIRRPMLRVRGLTQGNISLEIATQHTSVPFLWFIDCNGDYPFDEYSEALVKSIPQFIKARASEPTRSLICMVIPKVA